MSGLAAFSLHVYRCHASSSAFHCCFEVSCGYDSASLKERPLPASLPTALTPGLLKVPFALIFSVLTCDVYSLV